MFFDQNFLKWFEHECFSKKTTCLFLKKKLGFTPCKAERPLRGMELQEKEAQKG